MLARAILIENNDDNEFTKGYMEGLLNAYKINEYELSYYTDRYIKFIFITDNTRYGEIVKCLDAKFIKYKQAILEIKFN